MKGNERHVSHTAFCAVRTVGTKLRHLETTHPSGTQSLYWWIHVILLVWTSFQTKVGWKPVKQRCMLREEEESQWTRVVPLDSCFCGAPWFWCCHSNPPMRKVMLQYDCWRIRMPQLHQRPPRTTLRRWHPLHYRMPHQRMPQPWRRTTTAIRRKHPRRHQIPPTLRPVVIIHWLLSSRQLPRMLPIPPNHPSNHRPIMMTKKTVNMAFPFGVFLPRPWRISSFCSFRFWRLEPLWIIDTAFIIFCGEFGTLSYHLNARNGYWPKLEYDIGWTQWTRWFSMTMKCRMDCSCKKTNELAVDHL